MPTSLSQLAESLQTDLTHAKACANAIYSSNELESMLVGLRSLAKLMALPSTSTDKAKYAPKFKKSFASWSGDEVTQEAKKLISSAEELTAALKKLLADARPLSKTFGEVKKELEKIYEKE